MAIYSCTVKEIKPDEKTLSEIFLSREVFIQQKESINKDIKRVTNDLAELRNNFNSIETSLEEFKILEESKDLNKDSKLIKLSKLNKLLLLSKFI
jgi:hypothetical protein